MTLAVDSGGTSLANTGSATISPAAVTTLGADRILVATIYNQTVSSTNTVSSITSSNGLTWQKRSGLQWSGASGFGNADSDLEIWWAHAASVVTETITVHFSGTPDNASVGLNAVAGCVNFSNPWDPNGSLPATAFNNTGSNVAVTFSTFNTTDINTLAIGVAASASTTNISGWSAPYTQLYSAGTGSGTNDNSNSAGYDVYSSPQSGAAPAYGHAGLPNWGTLLDALTDASLPPFTHSFGTVIN